MMKVLVPIKRVIDPYVKIHVRKDAKGIEKNGARMSINPFDEIALEEAIRWKEKNYLKEIIAISIGDSTAQETLRFALALGADQGILINTKQILEPLLVAKCLYKITKKIQPDIIIMGKQAIDDDSNQTGQMLAALLDWPQGTFASEITFVAQNEIQVKREVDEGIETLLLTLPAVLTADLRLNVPRYPSLPNIMKAKKKPMEIIEINTLGVTTTLRTEIIKIQSPKPRKSGVKVENVADLLDFLTNKEKVL